MLKFARKKGQTANFAEFTKVDETLQDIRSGNLSDFTRPTTFLLDRTILPNALFFTRETETK